MTEAPVQMLDACTLVNRRPRNLTEYRAACRAATGEVVELEACAVQPGMLVWFGTLWRVITHVVLDGRTVELHMAAPDGTASRFTDIDTPVYRHVAG
jgi:hypothetical protein